MPENNTLVTAAAVAAVSFVTAVRTRVALRKERDACQHLAAELSATLCQRRVLQKIIADRGITLTEEEARQYSVFFPTK